MLVVLGVSIWGVNKVRHEQSLLRPFPDGVTTVGAVICVHESCDRSCHYQPTIEYRDNRGVTHTFKAPFQSDRPAVGSSVEVSYNRRVPGAAYDISVSPSSWDFPLATAWFGVAATSLSLVLLARTAARRWRRRSGAVRSGDRTRMDERKCLVSQARGALAGNVVIAAVATAIGISRHAGWVLAPALIGVALSTAVLFLRYKQANGSAPSPSASEVRRSTLLTMAAGVPAYVALAAAVSSWHR